MNAIRNLLLKTTADKHTPSTIHHTQSPNKPKKAIKTSKNQYRKKPFMEDWKPLNILKKPIKNRQLNSHRMRFI